MAARGGIGTTLERWWGRALTGVADAGLWLLRHLPLGDRAEQFLLQRTWGSGSADMLDAYLVSGYQNPRINLQSVLERHFLIQRLLGSEAHALMIEEVRWAIDLNEALRRRARELGVKMGTYRNPVKYAGVRRVDASISDREHEMLGRWQERLAGLAPTDRISILELACGSANDYRAFAEAGLGPHLDYLGVDLSPKNVANARRRHPEARFEVGDILGLPYADRAFDFVVASDIFEHLSPDAMERALDEAARLARHGMVLTFFNMADAPDHEIRRRRAYHWNRLSRPGSPSGCAAMGSRPSPRCRSRRGLSGTTPTRTRTTATPGRSSSSATPGWRRASHIGSTSVHEPDGCSPAQARRRETSPNQTCSSDSAGVVERTPSPIGHATPVE